MKNTENKILISYDLAKKVDWLLMSYVLQRINEVSISNSGNMDYEYRTDMFKRLSEDIKTMTDFRELIKK